MGLIRIRNETDYIARQIELEIDMVTAKTRNYRNELWLLPLLLLIPLWLTTSCNSNDAPDPTACFNLNLESPENPSLEPFFAANTEPPGFDPVYLAPQSSENFPPGTCPAELAQIAALSPQALDAISYTVNNALDDGGLASLSPHALAAIVESATGETNSPKNSIAGASTIAAPQIIINTVDDLAKPENRFTWQHHRMLIEPSAVPVPATAKFNPTTKVEAIYSPSFVTFNNPSPHHAKHAILWGASVQCTVQTPQGAQLVARDTIGMSDFPSGPDGPARFLGYVIQPHALTCEKPISQWPDGTVTQINDPKAFVVKIGGIDYLYVLYTSGVWNLPGKTLYPGLQQVPQCGNIGIAVFDPNKLIYRNDRFLTAGSQATCKQDSTGGYGRPDLLIRANMPTQIVGDTFAKPFMIPFSNYNSLNDANIVSMNHFSGIGDIDVVDLDRGPGTMLLYNGIPGIGVSYRPNDMTAWSSGWQVAQPVAGTVWDDAAGSPDLVLFPETCTANLYHSVTDYQAGVRYRLAIAVAKPPANVKFRVARCTGFN